MSVTEMKQLWYNRHKHPFHETDIGIFDIYNNSCEFHRSREGLK